VIIKIEPNSNGSHANQSTTPRIIPDGWIEVPPHLEADFIASGSFCNLTIETGKLVDITPTERPVEPIPEPIIDPQEDADALLVDHELRLTLLELGGI
jgi:hypothetical protein